MAEHTYLCGVSVQVSLLGSTLVEIVVPELYKAHLRNLRLACSDLSNGNGSAASRNARCVKSYKLTSESLPVQH